MLLNKIKQQYEQHGQLILGVDFDNTIFPLTDDFENEDRCREVLGAIQDLKKKLKGKLVICLWTVADPYSLKYKIAIMRYEKIAPDFVNKSPLDGQFGECRKPFFNLLLDDNAGLDETLKVLKQFTDEL